MALAHTAVVLGGLALGLVGTATATDAISLRAVAHSVDVPLLSASVIALRESMPTSLAHTLEPLTGGLGLAIFVASSVRARSRSLPKLQASVASFAWSNTR
jgi:hypothetical protein